jgi:hypothetical protein
MENASECRTSSVTFASKGTPNGLKISPPSFAVGRFDCDGRRVWCVKDKQ